MTGRIGRQGLPAVLVLVGLVFLVLYRASTLSTPQATSTATATHLPGLVTVAAVADEAGQTATLAATPLPLVASTTTAVFLPSPAATATETATPTASSSATNSPSPTATPSVTPTPVPPTATSTWTPSPTNTSVPTVTPQQVVPTRTPTAMLPPEITPSSTPTPLPSATPYLAGPFDSAIPYGQRFGVTSGTFDIAVSHAAGLPFGSCLNWKIHPDPPVPAGVTFWQVVRVREHGPLETWAEIEAAVLAQPGSTWVVGNEPDVRWQDNVTPESYARVYHDVYVFIKSLDSTARVAIGGVSQATPLRRAYLDRVLSSYQASYGAAMPIDIWTVHGFILREEADNWGVGIPPGMDGEGGIHYEIADHANVAIFQQNILDFRTWMAERGYADRPLAVTEYGILLPSDYGFPPEVVAHFMESSFDFFLNTAAENGYQPDGDRMVQWWFWYAVYDYDEFPTGNLFHRPTGELTSLGVRYRDYVNSH